VSEPRCYNPTTSLPLRDIAVLQDRARLSVMQGGRWVTRGFAFPSAGDGVPSLAPITATGRV
jgi:hypothetical protein